MTFIFRKGAQLYLKALVAGKTPAAARKRYRFTPAWVSRIPNFPSDAGAKCAFGAWNAFGRRDGWGLPYISQDDSRAKILD